MDFTKGSLLYEGKAKKIYETNHADVVLVEYKDSATAFNGEKKATITGKSRLNNMISSLLFSELKRSNISSHFVEQVSETEQLVQKVEIIPIEVVVRNIVAGSLSKRLGIEEGTALKKPIIEFYYKDDQLGDPFINEAHIEELSLATDAQLLFIKREAFKVNDVLKRYFKEKDIELVDFKLEFGTSDQGEVLLADEISPDTCRLWDVTTGEKLDKDVFRREIGSLTEAYQKLLDRIRGEVNHG
ncbi:phosphoribosylaminoimidazolesuccinocarboxamide synthase [Bacillus carboniphilus]|uniref:Phosphoribosylaminoimidazole-succinocarboxamide synthase n=1 Tax=Bacillus carboniphilus TaxID=86663 RepID=A0ABY9JUX6_9BACI|nr:phosphoribosylaminoimidazolesuccinocarboxamide synthase [Bacillus carboniphilus]WLR42242.1 phosphoribosylaminoimidazolesuccinocarboxamide synthase [Bacillus carboniphilus]